MAKHNKKESGKGVPFAAFAVGFGLIAVGCVANMETGTAQTLADREVVEEVKFGNFRGSAKVDTNRVKVNDNTINCAEGFTKSTYLYVENFTNDAVVDIKAGEYRETCLATDYAHYLADNELIHAQGNVNQSAHYMITIDYVKAVRGEVA